MLVAGGTGALGAAVVAALLEAGRPVTATYIVEAERERVERELAGAGELTFLAADLTDASVVARTVAAVDDLGAVVNLVGGYAGGERVHETDPATFDRMVSLNLRPLFLLAHHAMPRLLTAGGASFVGVSARAAVSPGGGAAAYSATKAAVLAFIQAIDAEYRDDGVRCNAVLPSVIDTPANRSAMPGADHDCWVLPAEIASVVAFLVSDQSAATSGAAIPVYGRA